MPISNMFEKIHQIETLTILNNKLLLYIDCQKKHLKKPGMPNYT